MKYKIALVLIIKKFIAMNNNVDIFHDRLTVALISLVPSEFMRRRIVAALRLAKE